MDEIIKIEPSAIIYGHKLKLLAKRNARDLEIQRGEYRPLTSKDNIRKLFGHSSG